MSAGCWFSARDSRAHAGGPPGRGRQLLDRRATAGRNPGGSSVRKLRNWSVRPVLRSLRERAQATAIARPRLAAGTGSARGSLASGRGPRRQPLAAGDRADRIVQRKRMRETYEQRREQRDTVDGQLALADWCAKHSLPAQETAHLNRILQLAPDHAAARKRLQFQRVDGSWVQRQDLWQGLQQNQQTRRIAAQVAAEAGGTPRQPAAQRSSSPR